MVKAKASSEAGNKVSCTKCSRKFLSKKELQNHSKTKGACVAKKPITELLKKQGKKKGAKKRSVEVAADEADEDEIAPEVTSTPATADTDLEILDNIQTDADKSSNGNKGKPKRTPKRGGFFCSKCNKEFASNQGLKYHETKACPAHKMTKVVAGIKEELPDYVDMNDEEAAETITGDQPAASTSGGRKKKRRKAKKPVKTPNLTERVRQFLKEAPSRNLAISLMTENPDFDDEPADFLDDMESHGEPDEDGVLLEDLQTFVVQNEAEEEDAEEEMDSDKPKSLIVNGICACCNKKEEDLDHEVVHSCLKCDRTFKLKSSLDRHRKVVHLEGFSHQCEVCGTRCADKGTLARHLYTHTGLRPYHCQECKKHFSRKYHLVRHVLQTGCGGRPRETHICTMCSITFAKKENLREHLRVHVEDVSTIVPNSKKNRYMCDYCSRDFNCASVLQHHLRSHTADKPFRCEYCPRQFPSQLAMDKHVRTHTGERPYECSDCDARFALKGTLNRHRRTHTGIKPHECSYCGKRFIQMGGLKAHLFHHTGQNGFPCEHCGKNFNRKARLQMHIRYVHEKIKPFTCEHCDKRFVRKEDLARHEVLHTGVKAYQCQHCDKTFAIKPSLKLHLLTHKKEQPKACHECGRAFIRHDCLIRHMRKKHREALDELGPEFIQARSEISLLEAFQSTGKNMQPLTEEELSSNIGELLSLLVDETTLKAFGWPDKPVHELLESVIKRCGHAPIASSEKPMADRLRENAKMLFTVVIDDSAVKTLLSSQSVDEVIMHVLRLAKS